MNKKEAILGMLNGHKVKSDIWNKGAYIYIDEQMNIVDEDRERQDINDFPYESWSIYEEPEKQPIKLDPKDNFDIDGVICKMTHGATKALLSYPSITQYIITFTEVKK